MCLCSTPNLRKDSSCCSPRAPCHFAAFFFVAFMLLTCRCEALHFPDLPHVGAGSLRSSSAQPRTALPSSAFAFFFFAAFAPLIFILHGTHYLPPLPPLGAGPLQPSLARKRRRPGSWSAILASSERSLQYRPYTPPSGARFVQSTVAHCHVSRLRLKHSGQKVPLWPLTGANLIVKVS